MIWEDVITKFRQSKMMMYIFYIKFVIKNNNLNTSNKYTIKTDAASIAFDIFHKSRVSHS